MKPRTKLQIEVSLLKDQLFDVESDVKKWAFENCLEHKGFETKNRVVCMDCGGKFLPELVSRKRAICPHCLTHLKIEKSRNTTDKQHVFVAYAHLFAGYQVVRYFEIFSYHKAGETTRYFCWEILQHWIKSNQPTQTIARLHTMNYSVDSWNGKMEIRCDNKRSYYKIKYDLYHHAIHPDSVFNSNFKKVGIDSNLTGLTILEATERITLGSHLETLLKCKQYDLLCYFKSVGDGNYWDSIKICIRNKYIVKDARLWIDYIDLLNCFGKDLRNAHYVCPKNLKKEHDKYVIKKRKKIQHETEIQNRLKKLKDEELFKARKEPFFGISFTDGVIEVKVLDSINEYMLEGDTLKHCVFTNEYYLKENSLCLTARINNEPIETIEISLEDCTILQCRGKYNNLSNYHDQIINLVNNNLHLIYDRMESKYLEKAS